MEEYKTRIADALLAEKLSYMGAVLVRGPKWCGKTTTIRERGVSRVCPIGCLRDRLRRFHCWGK